MQKSRLPAKSNYLNFLFSIRFCIALINSLLVNYYWKFHFLKTFQHDEKTFFISSEHTCADDQLFTFSGGEYQSIKFNQQYLIDVKKFRLRYKLNIDNPCSLVLDSLLTTADVLDVQKDLFAFPASRKRYIAHPQNDLMFIYSLLLEDECETKFTYYSNAHVQRGYSLYPECHQLMKSDIQRLHVIASQKGIILTIWKLDGKEKLIKNSLQEYHELKFPLSTPNFRRLDLFIDDYDQIHFLEIIDDSRDIAEKSIFPQSQSSIYADTVFLIIIDLLLNSPATMFKGVILLLLPLMQLSAQRRYVRENKSNLNSICHYLFICYLWASIEFVLNFDVNMFLLGNVLSTDAESNVFHTTKLLFNSSLFANKMGTIAMMLSCYWFAFLFFIFKGFEATNHLPFLLAMTSVLTLYNGLLYYFIADEFSYYTDISFYAVLQSLPLLNFTIPSRIYLQTSLLDGSFLKLGGQLFSFYCLLRESACKPDIPQQDNKSKNALLSNVKSIFFASINTPTKIDTDDKNDKIKIKFR